MKVGAVYPQIELKGSVSDLKMIGLAVEAMGLDHLVMYDHVVGAVHEGRSPKLTGPYTQNDPFHDPFVAFSFLAALTTRIEFITGVLILPQRQTVLVAKQAADLDLLSHERLCLGVGIGWNYVEYEALGHDFSTRGKRVIEQIGYLRRLWSETGIQWEGRFDRISNGNIVPRPERIIPIYGGGTSDAALRRAAALCDGFIFAQHNRALASERPRLMELLKEAGRDESCFGTHSFIMNEQRCGVSVSDAADAIRRWEDAGGTHASIVTMGKNFVNASQHIDFLAAVAAKI